MKKIRIYPRKQVKHPRGVWKYQYLGKSFDSVEETRTSREYVEFVKKWGNGIIEFFGSDGKIVDTVKIDLFNFRATANKHGECVRPSQNLKCHNRVPECSSCYSHGYNKGHDIGLAEGRNSKSPPNRNLDLNQAYNSGLKEGYARAQSDFVVYLQRTNTEAPPPMPSLPEYRQLGN